MCTAAQPAPAGEELQGPTELPPASRTMSLVVFALGVAVMLALYGNQEGVPGHDSFYHIKMAAMLPEHGLLREFPWLRFAYFTDEGHAFVSHHHGFHVLLVPFVHLSHWLTGDYVAGARWAMAAFFGVSLMLFDLVLTAGRVRWRWLWLVLFVLMPFQFFARHAFVRAISPSLAFMLLIVLLMFRRRSVLTALAVACYVHLYLGGVIYAPLLVGLYVLARIIGPTSDRSIPWRLILWVAAGWTVGLLTHPYLGGMWEFLKLQILGTGLSPDISVGREWQPYQGMWWFAQMSGVVLVVWAVAVSLRLRLGERLSAEAFMLLLAHFVFLVLTFKARRFVEYWPVFCLLSSAYLAAPHVDRLAGWCARRFGGTDPRRRKWLRTTGGVLMPAAVFAVIWLSPPWRELRRSSRCDYDLPAIEQAMELLRENSQPGDVVFTDDWDIFPVYFYYNSYNHYIVGLDPKFTHTRRPILWERYVKVSRGQVPADVPVNVRDDSGAQVTKKVHVELEDIREHFGASFVITDRDHRSLAAGLAARQDFAELVYPATSFSETRDASYLIFKIRQPEF